MSLRSVFAVGLLATLPACSGAKPHHASGTPSSPAPVASQEFVYSVVETSGAAASRSTFVVDVADPYVARVLTRTEQGQATGSAWGAAGVLALAADGSARQAQQTPPGFTGGDSHLDVALPLAASLGWAREGAPTTVAGHACSLWRTGPPLDNGSIEPPSRTESTSSCVDASGRILSDSWTRDGRTVRVRRLISSGVGPRLTPDGLEPGHTAVLLPATAATLLVRSVPATKLAPLMGVALPPPPPGQRLDRSTAMALSVPGGSAQQEGASFTYLGGGKLTVVTFTRYLVGAPHGATRGKPVRLAHATGRVVPVLAGLEADLVTRTGLAVKVQSDLSLSVLLTWLQQLSL